MPLEIQQFPVLESAGCSFVIKQNDVPVLWMKTHQPLPEYSEGDEPYYTVTWPTAKSRKSGLISIATSFYHLQSVYQLPEGFEEGDPVTIRFNSNDVNEEITMPVNPLYYPNASQFVFSLLKREQFNGNFAWLKVNTPFTEYLLDGEPRGEEPDKTSGIRASRKLTAHILDLYNTTAKNLLNEADRMFLGLNIELHTKGFRRFELL